MVTTLKSGLILPARLCELAPTTPDQLRDAIWNQRMSYEGAARFFGLTSSKPIKRWISGEVPVPRSISMALVTNDLLGILPKDWGWDDDTDYDSNLGPGQDPDPNYWIEKDLRRRRYRDPD